MPYPPKVYGAKWFAVALILIVVSGGAILWTVYHRQPGTTQVRSATATSSPYPMSAPVAPGAAASPTASAPVNSGVAAPLPGFQVRPLAVARESKGYQWTGEDGRSPEVIHKLAHNALEEARMLAENPRIKARQLVYLKQTAADLMEQSKLTGQKVDHMVLPGLNGQEFQFVITSSELNPSGQIGSFSGHLADDPNTTVTLAYKFGREAFTIVTPDEGIDSIEAEPREPGQVVVKSMDPSDYRPLHDHMILTTGARGGYAPLPDAMQNAAMPGMNMSAPTPSGR